MLVHLTVQEHGARKGTPRAAQIRLTRRALARQFAIVEHQPGTATAPGVFAAVYSPPRLFMNSVQRSNQQRYGPKMKSTSP